MRSDETGGKLVSGRAGGTVMFADRRNDHGRVHHIRVSVTRSEWTREGGVFPNPGRVGNRDDIAHSRGFRRIYVQQDSKH